MALLTASSLFPLLSDHSRHLHAFPLRNSPRIERFQCSFGTLKFGRHEGEAFSPLGGSSAKLLGLSDRASDLRAEIIEEEEGEEGEGVEVKSRGREFLLSLLANVVSVGVWGFTVVAVAVVSRNVRARVFATPGAMAGQMRVVNEERLPTTSTIEMNDDSRAEKKKNLPSKSKSSRSLFFASTSVATNEEHTQLEKQRSDEANGEFVAWMDDLKRDALNEGVSEGVLNWALEDVKVSKVAMVATKNAPEVRLTLDTYLKRMVPQRVSAGASRLLENSELLTEISQKFGVPTHILVSIWGIETNYGSYTGDWDIIQSLATMGFTEEREVRRKYFRGELLEALLMLEKGTAERGAGPQGEKRLRGSPAGAMGQCQFMPTSFRNYALDYDGDGHKDIWESKADVFASIANYFKEHGWKTGGPIFQKVQVPKKLDKSLLGGGVIKSVLDWEHKHGVHLNPGIAPPLPPDEMASLLMPNGPKRGRLPGVQQFPGYSALQSK